MLLSGFILLALSGICGPPRKQLHACAGAAAAGKKVLWRAAERCFGVPPKKPPKNEIKATVELPGLPDYVAATL